eukprot:337878-Rhodomonas_salina.2
MAWKSKRCAPERRRWRPCRPCTRPRRLTPAWRGGSPACSCSRAACGSCTRVSRRGTRSTRPRSPPAVPSSGCPLASRPSLGFGPAPSGSTAGAALPPPRSICKEPPSQDTPNKAIAWNVQTMKQRVPEQVWEEPQRRRHVVVVFRKVHEEAGVREDLPVCAVSSSMRHQPLCIPALATHSCVAGVSARCSDTAQRPGRAPLSARASEVRWATPTWGRQSLR